MILYKYILTFGSPVVLIIGGLMGLYYLKYLEKSNYILLIYLIISLVFDVVSRKVGGDTDNNLLLWPLLSLAELIIFSVYYLKTTVNNKIIIGLLGLGSIYMFWELYYLDVNDIIGFQPYSKVISSFIIVLFALINFYQALKKEVVEVLKNQYLNGVILVYFSLNILLLLPINFLINAKVEITIYIWTVYLFTTIFFYVSLSFYLWKNGRNQKQLHFGLQ